MERLRLLLRYYLPVFILVVLFAYSSWAQPAVMSKGRRLFDERKYVEAKKVLVTVSEKSAEFGSAAYYLGRIALIEQEFEVAIDQLEEAVESNENNADYHYWLGVAYGQHALHTSMIKQGYLATKAKSEFEEAVRLNPRKLEAMWGLIQFYTKAPGFMGGSLEKAMEIANRIKAIDKAEGHQAAAMVYVADKKNNLAEQEHLASIKMAPDSLKYQISLGNFYQTVKKYEQAFDILESVLKKDSSNLMAAYQIGKTSALSGLRLERGEACLLTCLKQMPKTDKRYLAGVSFRLGMIYEKKGRKDDAKKHYQSAIQYDPNLKQAREALEKLG